MSLELHQQEIRDRSLNGQGYVSKEGLKITYVNGEPLIDIDSAFAVIAAKIANLPKETRPAVKAAEDARAIIKELMQGLGGDMERFEANSKLYIEGIRQTRFAIVTECSQMTKPLSEVRQFFIGSDYKEQVTRLREFVELCERLQKLKESGFLDAVSDTMLRLATHTP
jgi:hypothetical protein